MAEKLADVSAIAAAYYAGARAELVERIRLRDAALTTYFAGITLALTVLGILVGSYFQGGRPLTGGEWQFWLRVASLGLLIIPLVARATTSIVCQHHEIIGGIERYLVLEFDPKVRDLGVGVPQWDASESVSNAKAGIIFGRASSLGSLVVWSSFLAWILCAAIQTSAGLLDGLELSEHLADMVAGAALAHLGLDVTTVALLALALYWSMYSWWRVWRAKLYRMRCHEEMKRYIEAVRANRA